MEFLPPIFNSELVWVPNFTDILEALDSEEKSFV